MKTLGILLFFVPVVMNAGTKNNTDSLLWRKIASSTQMDDTNGRYYHDSSTITYDTLKYVATTVTYQFDTATQTWSNLRRESSTYDANWNETITLTEDWVSGGWQGLTRTTRTFDVNHNELTTLGEDYSMGAWLRSQRVTRTFDVDNNELTEFSEYMNGGVWTNSSLTTYSYSQGKMTMIWSQIWNTMANAWANNNRMSFSYNGAGLRSEMWVQYDSSGVWLDDSRTTYQYSASNKLVSQLSETRSHVDGSYTNNSRSLISYDAYDDSIEYKRQSWFHGGWVDAHRDTMIYNNHLVINDVSQHWDTSHHIWINELRDLYTYTVSGQTITYINEYYSGSNWVGSSKSVSTYDANGNNDHVTSYYYVAGAYKETGYITYYYESYLSTVGISEFAAVKEARVFPNPFDGCIKIDFTAASDGKYVLNIFDLTGKQIFSNEAIATTGDNTITLNTSNLDKGMYFYYLTVAGETLKGKLVKE